MGLQKSHLVGSIIAITAVRNTILIYPMYHNLFLLLGSILTIIMSNLFCRFGVSQRIVSWKWISDQLRSNDRPRIFIFFFLSLAHFLERIPKWLKLLHWLAKNWMVAFMC